MENTYTAIELGSKKIKLVIGYELNGKVYSIYTMNKSYGPLLPDGRFFDFQKLVDCVASIKELNDPDAKIKTKISECVLCLPSDGLEIFQTKQRTPVISEHGKISPIDIRNLYSLIKNSSSKTSNVLVDIVPETYILDETRTVKGSPIGDMAHTLIMNAKVHLSPDHIYTNYMGVLDRAKIDVKRVVVAPLGAVEYLATMDDIPGNYFMIDIGSDTTSVSLVGKNILYGCQTFNWGSDIITTKIAEKFNVSMEDAEKYKKIYGIDEREMQFRAPICSDNTGESGTKHYYKEDMNEIIRECLDDLAKKLKEKIDVLLEKQNPELSKLPLVLIGGGSQLKGLVEFLSSRFDSSSIKVVVPNTIGARDATYTNCLGMILVASKYMSMNDDSRNRAKDLVRDEQ